MKKQNIEPIEDLNYVIRDLSIPEIIPNNIDNFLVSINDGHHLVVLPPVMIGTQFKNWKKSRGGIFSKDVLKYSLKKEHGKYILVKGNNTCFIARLITDDELLNFEALQLIDGKIKDKPYMILKHVIEEHELTSTKIDLTEKTIEESEYIFPASTPKAINDEEPDYHGTSISLFTSE